MSNGNRPDTGARRKARGGYTLVELAISLSVIGLLLTGILKGQELINNAKTKAIAERQNSMKSAWYAYVTRYGGIPGDHAEADIYVLGAAPGNGDGVVEYFESPLAFQHLTSAGFLRCAQCTATETGLTTPSNSPVNTYGGVMAVFEDFFNFAARNATGSRSARLQIHTGNKIPSNIIAEVDRKVDDGIPNTGDFLVNSFDHTTARTPIGASVNDIRSECMSLNPDGTGTTPEDAQANQPQYWRPLNLPIHGNCGGSVDL